MSPKNRLSKPDIKAIILAGTRDFGRCPLASRLPAALWPVLDKPVLQRLLQHLARYKIYNAVICSNGDANLLKNSIAGENSIQIEFLNESLPAGSAGCIRNICHAKKNTLLLVLNAAIISPPPIDVLITAHQARRSEMTVVFQTNHKNNQSNYNTAEIYICQPEVLQLVPKQGYFDFKEGLIPAMVRAGKTVNAAVTPKPVGNFRNRRQYLDAIADLLENTGDKNDPASYRNAKNGPKNIWQAHRTDVAPSAKIYGPVVIMADAVISDNAVVFGPTIIGRNVVIGKNTLVQNTVFWAGSSIGKNCQSKNCVIDYDAKVPDNSFLQNTAVIYKEDGKFKNLADKTIAIVNTGANRLKCAAKPLIAAIDTKLLHSTDTDRRKTNIANKFFITVLAGVFLWSYWPQLIDLWKFWQRSDEYSSGLLVPFLAIYLLWVRRRQLAEITLKPSISGLVVFIAAQAFRYFGLFFMYASAERLSLIISAASLILLLFGWKLLRKMLPLLLFVCLMLPLPRSIHNAVMLPLQNLATKSAVFFLETIGYLVIREGNVIYLNNTAVAVAEACNGLRMLTSFFVIIGLVVLLISRQWWKKLILLLSGLPIALLCNATRLTITAIAFTTLETEKYRSVFHNFGGYAMMPLALLIVILELWFLARLTSVAEKEKQQIIISSPNN